MHLHPEKAFKICWEYLTSFCIIFTIMFRKIYSTAEDLIVLNIKILYIVYYNLHCSLREDDPLLFVCVWVFFVLYGTVIV